MEPKTVARDQIYSSRENLRTISHLIHAHPEIGFEEHQASVWLSEALTDAGFNVQRASNLLPTSFVARFGSGSLHVAICAEYDALPGIGHACGHNIIAAIAMGAGFGISKVADDVGLTVSVVGTPAEEGGGGKISLLKAGAFSDVHAAMMAHPYPWDIVEPSIIACEIFDVDYFGKASHAASFPELGINAGDAQTIAQASIGLLRQHIRSTDKIHGIITKGGEAPNIIPEHTSAKYIIRSETLEQLGELREKVHRCFEAGAIATGARVEIRNATQPYAQMSHDSEMATLYKKNAESLGRTFPDLGELHKRLAISTDMGNVSLAIPSIHPMIGVNSLPAVNHQPEFAAYCVTSDADKATIDGAIALAWTAIDIATDESLRNRLMAVSEIQNRE